MGILVSLNSHPFLSTHGTWKAKQFYWGLIYITIKFTHSKCKIQWPLVNSQL
jgi:hypothetical protein